MLERGDLVLTDTADNPRFTNRSGTIIRADDQAPVCTVLVDLVDLGGAAGRVWFAEHELTKVAVGKRSL